MHISLERRIPAILAILALAGGSAARSEENSSVAVPNSEFSQGNNNPAGWKLSGGQGRWVDHNILEVTGNGNDDNCWRCDYRFTSGGVYQFEMRARNVGGCSSAISGPNFANNDQPLSAEWAWSSQIFRVPDNVENDCLRLGQWHQNGTGQFDTVRLTPVMPVYKAVGQLTFGDKAVGQLTLGDGESIQKGRYVFNGWMGHQGGNFHRTLVHATAGFNSDRWCFWGNAEVIYRFGLPGYPFRSAHVAFDVSYHTRGGCVAEVSRDRKSWRQIATRDSLGHAEADVPADLLSAEELFVRLRAKSKDDGFQVNQIDFSADLAGTPPEGVGQTVFAKIEKPQEDLAIESISLLDSEDPACPKFRVTAKNRGTAQKKIAFTATATLRPTENNNPSGEQIKPSTFGVMSDVALQKSQSCDVEAILDRCGTYDIQLSVGNSKQACLATLPWTLSEHYRADFGQKIAGVAGNADVWWCEATWKISQKRAAPKESSPAATLSAARNDREAVQIVVRPKKELKQLTAEALPLQGPNGATIKPENIRVLREYYHWVHTPTDRVGVRDWWPDALPPIDKPLDLPAGKNQPLWVLVYVPTDAPAGDYAGTIRLKAEGWAADVPVKLHVWNFALPVQNHIETAFGLSMGNPFRYQQLKDEGDKRRAVDAYLQNFAEHRISPYISTPLDPIRVKFISDAKPPRAEVDFTAFDAAMTRAIEKYHFTNFQLPIEGMGGGTYEGHNEGKIGEFGEHTPEYQAMFSSYLKQLESHLREKGWLNMAYIYWFDEPEPKDYPFVRAGFEKLKKYAPGLRTMLTEEPGSALSGPIDIWCPISFNYDHKAANKQRDHGDQLWWYVCCGPKEPFCTLFIDHPATDLRVWLWQTWQRNITGILIWESTWWTSREDIIQNPYQDPMGYVSGSKPEEKKYWGNGDGRFVYPPLAAAAPGISGDKPILDAPVSSIRWEMLREGIEDYEYLWLLRDLVAKHRAALTPEQINAYESLLKVPDDITSTMTTFTTDPAPLYARRAAVAEAIEKLSK